MAHTLPSLRYAYDALEPHLDEQTLKIHHDLHHKSYVDGLNKAEVKLDEAREANDFSLIKHGGTWFAGELLPNGLKKRFNNLHKKPDYDLAFLYDLIKYIDHKKGFLHIC